MVFIQTIQNISYYPVLDVPSPLLMHALSLSNLHTMIK